MIPYIFYMASMMVLITYSLNESNVDTEFYNEFHYPLLGFLIVFIAHLVKVEYLQMRNQGVIKHFEDPYNWADLIQLTMSIVFVLLNFIDYGVLDMTNQRTWSAILVLLLFYKFFDWMRLFDGTAFFMRLTS